MYRTADADIVHCPVCDVPHRSSATHCDSCSQPLHEPADLEALRRELSALRRSMALGLAGVAAMVGLNVFLGGRVGVMLFYVAPLGWLVKSAGRYRIVRGWIVRCSARSP
ncbi:MAG: hypothetical protein ACLQVI_39790 [Polyangiaceae bacterium]|jgi:hypothetical protein